MGRTQSIIALIIMKRTGKTITQGVRVYRKVEYASNNRLVLGKFIYMGRHQKVNICRRYELEKHANTNFKVELLEPYAKIGCRICYTQRRMNPNRNVGYVMLHDILCCCVLFLKWCLTDVPKLRSSCYMQQSKQLMIHRLY